MCVCIHRRCGVKHQKDSRSQGTEKECKVCGKHSGSYPVWTGHICPDSVRHEKRNESNAGIPGFQWAAAEQAGVFTDGARNIKSSIEEMFPFHPYTVILDWYHLKKKCQELLSMAVKGKDMRNKTLEKRCGFCGWEM